MTPTFTIDLVICTYNNAALLRKTLGSIALLRVPAYVKWGVLVVNNNCTDDTVSVVDEYIHNGIIPIRMVMEKEQGLTSARICGVQNTCLNWIAFIDDDCLLAEDWMVQAEMFIENHPNCGVFGSRVQLVWEKEPLQCILNYPYAYAGKNNGETAKRLNAVAGLGMVAQRKALKVCGWMHQQFLADRTGGQLTSGGDMEITLRVGSMYEVWYNPACRLQHLIPERRTTKKYLRRMLFGLGASRHNVAALTWRGSYPLWFLYSIAYSFGMVGLGTVTLVQEWIGKRDKAGWRIAFSPALGWYAAMVYMLGMNVQKRKNLLGCAKKYNNILNQSV